MVSRRALMSQVGCAAGFLRCRKASSRGHSLHVLATAAMSTSHLHTWNIRTPRLCPNMQDSDCLLSGTQGCRPTISK